jgi:hypothetical protein
MTLQTTYATLDDLLQVEPTIRDYGVLDWNFELSRSQKEVQRVLAVRWWPQYSKQFKVNITIVGQMALMDETRLEGSQWTMATVYHALAYHICPKLTKFENQNSHDKFQVMMDYYSGRFEHEMDLSIRQGVQYDINLDGTIAPYEKIPDTYLRLRR